MERKVREPDGEAARCSAWPLSNEALLPAAWSREAAGSQRSLAAIMIGRRSRAPRR